MTRKDPDSEAMEMQTAHLELALIDQFIRSRGVDLPDFTICPTTSARHCRNRRPRTRP